MANVMLQRIEKGLAEKRQNLYHWLESAPAEEKQLCLCEDDACVEPHLQLLDTSLEKAADGTLGVCQVCHGYVDANLLEVDYTASVCLDHLSAEERRRLESELELSQIVQRALLPQRLPTIPGLDLAAFNRPAEILGGDYFDFFQLNDGVFGLAIADIVGHGVSAGMLMSSLQASLRTLVPQSSSPADVLERINHFYIHNINLTTFITAFLAHFDPQTQMLTYSNAGHTSPLILRRDGDAIWLKPTGAAIGLVEDYHPGLETATLFEADVLVLYTDGITEAMNLQREQFGTQRLEKVVEENRDLTAQELAYAIRHALRDFTASENFADDITIVTCRIG